jgi:hypothetical protein
VERFVASGVLPGLVQEAPFMLIHDVKFRCRSSAQPLVNARSDQASHPTAGVHLATRKSD